MLRCTINTSNYCNTSLFSLGGPSTFIITMSNTLGRHWFCWCGHHFWLDKCSRCVGVELVRGCTGTAGVAEMQVGLVGGCVGMAGVAEMRVELVCGSAGTAAIGATLRDDDAWCCPSADADGMVSLSKDN